MQSYLPSNLSCGGEQSSLKNKCFSKGTGNNRQILWPSQRSEIDAILFIVTNHAHLNVFQQLVSTDSYVLYVSEHI